MIVVGGGVGTLIEACAAHLKAKPIIAVKGSRDVAENIADTSLDDRGLVKVVGMKDPKKAVEKALSFIE